MLLNHFVFFFSISLSSHTLSLLPWSLYMHAQQASSACRHGVFSIVYIHLFVGGRTKNSHIHVAKLPVHPVLNGFNGGNSGRGGRSVGSHDGILDSIIHSGHLNCLPRSISGRLGNHPKFKSKSPNQGTNYCLNSNLGSKLLVKMLYIILISHHICVPEQHEALDQKSVGVGSSTLQSSTHHT